MQWHLTVDINMKASFRKLQYGDPVLSLGSCFSTHMGDRLEAHHWPISSNPFGILYNPLSIANALDSILDMREYSEEELVFNSGRYVSMDHHGDYSGADAAQVISRINASIRSANEKLQKTATIILTFGTAFCYEYKPTGRIAGNCHKIDSGEFDRRMLSTNEIAERYGELINRLEEHSPGIQWIFTVSPVRHWKDGGADNQWSKSILTCAVRELEQSFEQGHYFPAYEIMMDELRDHRFYKEDLVHPNSQAVDHIWERFGQSCLSGAALKAHKDIAAVNNRLEHRPLHPESPEHLKFVEETKRQIGLLKDKYPHIKI